MKLLLLGDSFADEHALAQSVPTKTYQDQIRKRHDMVNMSLRGTSLSWAYRLYQEHKNHYDRVIVMVTQPGRLQLPQHSVKLRQPGRRGIWGPLPNLHTVKKLQTNADYQGQWEQRILKAAEDYFLYLENQQDSRLFHDLMLDQMKSRETLLVPCFNNSVCAEAQPCLMDLSLREKITVSFPDTRICHLNQQHHDMLAEELLNWIENGSFDLAKLIHSKI